MNDFYVKHKNDLNRFIKILLLFFLVGYVQIVFAQNNPTKIDNTNFNEKYLEHLIKIKIDSVRKVYNCEPLINDSILYVASKHHSNYMNKNNRLSHFEINSEKTKTPQLRAAYYGAKKYLVGENVLTTPYNIIITTKKKKKINTSTYHQLAKSIVVGWVNSPGHFKNIITPSYQITGISIAINKEKNTLYACQKFAKVKYKYSFRESKILFPYSTYKLQEPKHDFIGIKRKLIEHNHKFNLKHNDLEKCKRCNIIIKKKPPITLQYKRNSFVLRIENTNYVKQLIQNKTDGFAVEIVEFDDYMCGNPEYYTKPSHRNGQCGLNGKTLKPIYRKELVKGYKRKKRNENVKFFPFIFGADSIRFFDRFARYKIEKYNNEYFEINLGKLPKNTYSFWNHNLVYIQDNQICHIDYFTNYCGELFSDYQNTRVILPKFNNNYKFKLDTISFSFSIPFEKNKAILNKEYIKPFVESLTNLDFTIDSISIKAFSSIEGDSLANNKLQYNRAKSIISILEKKQKSAIKTNITTATSWEQFINSIRNSEKWKFLTSFDKAKILNLVNTKYSDSLEPILKNGRKANIDMNCTIDITDNNLKHYINKEFKQINKKLKKVSHTSKEYKSLLNKYTDLYKFTYYKVVNNKIDVQYFSNLILPKYFAKNVELEQLYILFGYQFYDDFKENKYWFSNKDKWRTDLIKNRYNDLFDEFIYLNLKLKTDYLITQKYVAKKSVDKILNELSTLSNFHNKDNIDKLVYNLNMVLLNKTYLKRSKHKDIDISIDKVIHYYRKNEALIDKETTLKLAKLSVFYNDIGRAQRLLSTYMNDETILKYAMPLYFQHPSSQYSKGFYDKLKSMSEIMKKENWCNLFINECGIPFQSFDDEELRNIFCEKCQNENKIMKKITE